MLQVDGWHVRSTEDGLPEIKRIANVNIKDYTALSSADASDQVLVYDASVSALRSCVLSNLLAGTASNVTVADAAGDTTTFVLLAGSATGASLPVLSDADLTFNATTGILTAGGFSGPLNGTVGATAPAAGTFTNLTVNGNTILGDASGDTLTINAGTRTTGNPFVDTLAAGTLAAGSLDLESYLITYTGDSGGTTNPRGFVFQHRNTGANAVNNPIAIRSFIRNAGTGLIAQGYAFEGNVWSSGTGGFTQADAFRAGTPTISAGTIGTLRGLRINNQGNASVTTALGVLVDDFSGSTTMRAFAGEMSSGSGKANLYMSGTADNILRGNVRIGSTTAPTVALDVTGAALISSTLGVTGAISSSTLTSGRVALVGTSGAIIDDAGITYDAAANSITATTFIGALTGNATTATTATNITVANEATDTSCFLLFATDATGDLGAKSNANMTFNSNTGVVTLASSVLTTADINGGTVDGAVIGGSSPAAGTFTTLTVNGNTTLGDAAADTLTINAETVSQPNIPLFSARQSTTAANVTGAGGTHTVIADTEIYDQSGDYNSTTGVFTAPITGPYDFSGNIRIDQVPAAATVIRWSLVTSNRSYVWQNTIAAASLTEFCCVISAEGVEMDAADTASITVQVSGGAGNTADIIGAGSPTTFFSGRKVA